MAACSNFLDDGRGCCRTCDHFHGPDQKEKGKRMNLDELKAAVLRVRDLEQIDRTLAELVIADGDGDRPVAIGDVTGRWGVSTNVLHQHARARTLAREILDEQRRAIVKALAELGVTV